MGATFLVRQVKPNLGKVISVGNRIAFQERFEKNFGPLPHMLSVEDLPMLRILSNQVSKDDTVENPWEQLIDRICKHGVIELWAEY